MITEQILASIEVKKQLLASREVYQTIDTVIEQLVKALLRGNKVLFCGNGGSAAGAQHLAAELSGRFYKNRPPLFALALHCDTSFLTAVANDYSFEEVYSRAIDAIGRQGDMLLVFSTSGNSANILKAARLAKTKSLQVVGMTGIDGGKLKALCDYMIQIPSSDTPRIQEAHLLIGHIICQQVEESLFPNV